VTIVIRPGDVPVVSADFGQRPRCAPAHRAYAQALDHEERPVHWAPAGLDYTFIRLAFERMSKLAAARMP
jgi:hypothetical protein